MKKFGAMKCTTYLYGEIIVKHLIHSTMAQATLIIYSEYIKGRTTGKEVERISFPSIKSAFDYCYNERAKAWEPMRAKLGWWEIKDKRVSLPYEGGFRRWAVITK